MIIDSRRAAALLRALANESRLLILCELLEGERCAGQLESVAGLSQSALSQHLARLRADRLVKTRRVGKTICYSLNGRETPVVLETLYRMFCLEGAETSQAKTCLAVGSLPVS